MKIYLKGYYGYKNFGDELLLFWVIEEIFSRYNVEELVIEAWDTSRIKSRIDKNSVFLEKFYQSKKSTIDRNKIIFFSPEEYFKQQKDLFSIFLPSKRKSYFNILIWKHPYKEHFKIFGWGEVIDESRPFPHNGWNLLLLYTSTIFSGNFALRGGLWSQESNLIQLLTSILINKAKHLLLREQHSQKIAEKKLWKTDPKIELFHDFSLNIIEYRKTHNREVSNKKEILLINLSPSIDKQKRKKIQEQCRGNQLSFFPCDLNFDLKMINAVKKENETLFLWTEHNLDEIFDFLNKTQAGFWSRLHFLYCLKQLNIPYTALSKHNKINSNL